MSDQTNEKYRLFIVTEFASHCCQVIFGSRKGRRLPDTKLRRALFKALKKSLKAFKLDSDKQHIKFLVNQILYVWRYYPELREHSDYQILSPASEVILDIIIDELTEEGIELGILQLSHLYRETPDTQLEHLPTS